MSREGLEMGGLGHQESPAPPQSPWVGGWGHRGVTAQQSHCDRRDPDTGRARGGFSRASQPALRSLDLNPHNRDLKSRPFKPLGRGDL